MGIDRDRDGYLDGDEVTAGSDPGDPLSIPVTAVASTVPVIEGLRSIHPNPFNSSATIRFTLARPGPVSVSVYDLLGRRIGALVHEAPMTAGEHTLRWDGHDAAGDRVHAGVYFVRLEAAGRLWQRTVVRLE
jgi:hypothetical protein